MSAAKNKTPPIAPAPNADDLPHALTFFLSARERRAVLTALRKRRRNRAAALLHALRIQPTIPPEP